MGLYDSNEMKSMAEVEMTEEELQEDLHFFEKLQNSGTAEESLSGRYKERISIIKARLLIGAYTE